MQNLFNFIVKNIHWWLFLLLVSLSMASIIGNNAYQQSKYLKLEHEFVGRVHSISSVFFSHFGIEEINYQLMSKIAELESQTRYLENVITEHNIQKSKVLSSDSIRYMSHDFLRAKVVNQSNNYITLNKGTSDNITTGMGVLSIKGVVGVIISVSSNFSVVVPILNSKWHLSCKVKNSDYSGILTWDGKDPLYSYLMELPRHAEFQVGDTVVTTGYSSIFPEGIGVGVVEDSKRQKDDNFNSLKVKLFTDFRTLKLVFIVRNKYKEEQLAVEKEADMIFSRIGGSFYGN